MMAASGHRFWPHQCVDWQRRRVTHLWWQAGQRPAVSDHAVSGRISAL